MTKRAAMSPGKATTSSRETRGADLCEVAGSTEGKDPGPLDFLAVEVTSWKPHLETAVEVCLREAALCRRVGFAFLDIDNVDEWSFVSRGPMEPIAYRLLRRARRRRIRHLADILRSRGVSVMILESNEPRRMSSAAAGINSIDSLRDFRWRGAALGVGVLSSLIRIAGDLEPDVNEYRRVVDRLLTSACTSFDLTTALIDQFTPGVILAFNGRFATPRGITEAARLGGVAAHYHEVSSTPDRYYLSNRQPQSAEHSRELLWDGWNRAGEERETVGAAFFQPGRGGAVLPSRDYLSGQVPGKSVAPTGRRRVVYYASSIDEFASVEDGVEHTVFESQRAAVQWLSSWARDRSDVELIIRLHPKMRTLSQRELDWWGAFRAENVLIVDPESSVDSYALAKTADRAVCYHSSMGVEATYMGRVSILIGDADYRGLDCVYEPRSVDELESMLEDDNLVAKPQRHCLPYGFDRMTRGIEYRFYQPKSFDEGTFDGKAIPGMSVFERIAVKAVRGIDQMVTRSRGADRP